MMGYAPVPRRHRVHPKSLRLFEGVEYSGVPVMRVNDAQIPALRFARYFPAEAGIRISVHTREHPPAHIHVEFIGQDEVKLQWPDLSPLKNERKLSNKELAKVESYLSRYSSEVEAKVRSVFT
jgi:hypothetical protein